MKIIYDPGGDDVPKCLKNSRSSASKLLNSIETFNREADQKYPDHWNAKLIAKFGHRLCLGKVFYSQVGANGVKFVFFLNQEGSCCQIGGVVIVLNSEFDLKNCGEISFALTCLWKTLMSC